MSVVDKRVSCQKDSLLQKRRRLVRVGKQRWGRRCSYIQSRPFGGRVGSGVKLRRRGG